MFKDGKVQFDRVNLIKFSISIVSHGHLRHVYSLLQDLNAFGRNDFEVILTFNIHEEWDARFAECTYPLNVIWNPHPKGFAENHNAAFKAATGRFFVLLNPDIRLPYDPFDSLIPVFENYERCICAPRIINKNGEVEDSARNFPSPWLLAKKFFGKIFHVGLPAEKIRTLSPTLLSPDWIAGMFIMVPAPIYLELDGLDENYFLYYEDVDFCARAHRMGITVLVVNNVSAIHTAQRDSHRRLQYTFWHLRSALRFFCSPAYLSIVAKRVIGFRLR
jgi:GT2 family glycosyltransferase